MKKCFKNILTKAGNNSAIALLISVVIITTSLVTLLNCTLVKENIKAASGQLETQNIQTPNEPEENIQTQDIQAKNTVTDDISSQSIGNPPEAEPIISDASIFLEDIVISLNENKQNIAAKLNEAGLSYEEIDSDEMFYPFDHNKFDSYYRISTPVDLDTITLPESLEVYFKDDICVRLKLLNEVPKTFRGIHKGSYSSDPYSQLIEKYGDSFEKHIYAAQGVYCVYLYTSDDYICEFTILEDTNSICNADIYVSRIYPIYTHKEELTEEDLLKYRRL